MSGPRKDISVIIHGGLPITRSFAHVRQRDPAQHQRAGGIREGAKHPSTLYRTILKRYYRFAWDFGRVLISLPSCLVVTVSGWGSNLKQSVPSSGSPPSIAADAGLSGRVTGTTWESAAPTWYYCLSSQVMDTIAVDSNTWNLDVGWFKRVLLSPLAAGCRTAMCQLPGFYSIRTSTRMLWSHQSLGMGSQVLPTRSS